MTLGSDQFGRSGGSPISTADANAEAVAQAARIAAKWGMSTPAANTMGQQFAATSSGFYNPAAAGYATPATGTAGGYISPENANQAAVRLAAHIANGGTGKIADFYNPPTAGNDPAAGGTYGGPNMMDPAMNGGVYYGGATPGSAAAATFIANNPGMYGGGNTSFDDANAAAMALAAQVAMTTAQTTAQTAAQTVAQGAAYDANQVAVAKAACVAACTTSACMIAC